MEAMKLENVLGYVVFALFSATCSAVQAETKTVALSVPEMTCAAFSILVKKSLTRLEGVSKVLVSFEKSEALVTFDGAKTDAGALVKATTDAGFPSILKN